MSGLPLFLSVQEAREANNKSRREAGQLLGMSPRTLESLEYDPDRLRPHHVGLAAREYGSPELCMQICTMCDASFPKLPVPHIVEGSLLANAAKQAKEAGESELAMGDLARVAYGKTCAEDLTDLDRALVIKGLMEAAQAAQAFRKYCLVLVKRYGYSMDEINRIVAGAFRSKEKSAHV